MTIKRLRRAKINSRNLVENSLENHTPRHDYLLEREKIKNEIGDLENIRLRLGLSQRRICMLLLVDPSAWTRWNKTEAPPHIYQALRWLLELRKINPDVTAPNNIESRVELLQSATQSKIRDLENSVEILEKTLALSSTVQPATQPDYSQIFEALVKRIEVAAVKKPSAKIKLQRRRKAKVQAKQKAKSKPRVKIKAKLKIKKKKQTRPVPKKKRRARS